MNFENPREVQELQEVRDVQAEEFNRIFNLVKFDTARLQFNLFNYNFLVENCKIGDKYTLVLGSMIMRGRGSFWFGKLVLNSSDFDIVSSITAESRAEVVEEISRLISDLAINISKV